MPDGWVVVVAVLVLAAGSAFAAYRAARRFADRPVVATDDPEALSATSPIDPG